MEQYFLDILTNLNNIFLVVNGIYKFLQIGLYLCMTVLLVYFGYWFFSRFFF